MRHERYARRWTLGERLFVCLFNWSVRADTRIGPDETRLKQRWCKLEYAEVYVGYSLAIR